jgi:hypothetical protein
LGHGVIESCGDIREDGEELDDTATETIAIGAATIKARQFSMRILAGNL